jgi:hypothetical protein
MVGEELRPVSGWEVDGVDYVLHANHQSGKGPTWTIIELLGPQPDTRFVHDAEGTELPVARSQSLQLTLGNLASRAGAYGHVRHDLDS